ncbi:hypothetical protein OG762_01990 [Streptomyces sp. NBC_01136]|nr:hypothetical protein OG762_01990 [Streptomyces sp. NBC_01136]
MTAALHVLVHGGQRRQRLRRLGVGRRVGTPVEELGHAGQRVVGAP